jgi:hypothetical protein
VTAPTTSPCCGGEVEITKGICDGPEIIRKAELTIVHFASCESWQRTAREHGSHPDITTLVHDSLELILTERAA